MIPRRDNGLKKAEKEFPNPKKKINKKKVMLCVWWDYLGIIYFELLDNNETIDSYLYASQLEMVQEALVKKRSVLINRKIPLLLHDNAKPHVSKIVQEKINDLGWEVLPHPPYSPDIAPSDFHLFRSLQNSLQEKKFKNLDDIKSHIQDFFDSKTQSFYQKGIEMLPQRWKSVVDSNGDYFDY